MNHSHWKLLGIAGLMVVLAPAAWAQGPSAVAPSPDTGATASSNALPEWPPRQNAQTEQKKEEKDTGILAKFREDLSKPLTPGGKAKRAFIQMLFPGIPATAAAAGISMASDSRLDRDYGMGGDGFVRRWGSAFGTNAVDLFMGDFVLASALHQDPRYHPSKKKGFGNRLGYAISRAVVTYSDSGKQEFNASDVFGTMIGTGASTAWHHESDRRVEFWAERFGWAELTSVGFNVVKEFIFYRNYPRQ